ncbi:MAG: hypothetical protein P1V13_21160 [Rhizobiaceae bacterium]|nr:hypothetical protein [Rhizobiaceae bacterium]
MIIIEPAGGLCNRLRSIHSAIALADSLERSLEMVWLANDGMGARFSELFERPAIFSRIYEFDKNKLNLLKNIKYIFARNFRIQRLRPDLTPPRVMDLSEAGFDFESLKIKRRIHIKSWSLFYGEDKSFYQFEPVKELQEKIDAVTCGFDKTVGVHIRRSDLLESVEGSPTELFILEMRREIEREPETKFFLSTDDPEEERYLSDLFGDRIIIFNKDTRSRQEVGAIKDAVVDLYCLASTCKIIGSKGSSFTEVAARMAQIPLTIINSKQR